jgi:hypothetical protein
MEKLQEVTKYSRKHEKRIQVVAKNCVRVCCVAKSYIYSEREHFGASCCDKN